MPKMKTHSGAKKRIRLTGRGKLMRQQVNRRHMFEGKSSRRTRRLALDETIAAADRKTAKRLLARG